MLLGDASRSERSVSTDERSTAETAADDAISASIRRQLGADSLVGRFAIGIRSLNGQVTLSGTVGSYAARDRAVAIALGTEGVSKVLNRIVVNTNY